LGIESKVQTVTIDSKETWHRVQVGPIAGRDKADALQKQLRENDIDSLLMRAKHG
jgi:cell division protein FtsN